MNQHQLRRVVSQALQAEPYRFLPRRAARHRIEHLQVPGRLGIERRVVGVHDAAHAIDAGVSAEALQRVAQQRLAGERQILLGPITPKARATAGRHDQRHTCRQTVTHIELCQAGTLGGAAMSAKPAHLLPEAAARS
jgi:hypothetical protein